MLSRTRDILNHCLAGVVVAYLTLPSVAAAKQPCIAVLYPQVREPYRIVLDEIMSGIEEASQRAVRRTPLGGTDGEPDIDCDAAIGLGRAGMQAAAALAPRLPAVAAAVLMEPGQESRIPTISFVPEPGELFIRLKHFFPEVRTVTVVFDPSHSRRLVDDAVLTGKRMGIEVSALPARSLHDAVAVYERVLKKINPKAEALWLIHDPTTIDSGAVLTLILERAWKRRLVVFSSQVAHVRHGVLFSVYPDNEKLGRRLARLAEECTAGACQAPSVMALRELDTAVNSRTASRLEIRIDRRHDPYVDLMLPAR